MQDVFQTSQVWIKDKAINLIAKNTTESTNDLAKIGFTEDPTGLPDLVLYLTGEQTKGRGRGQNIWLNSAFGHSFLCSWSFSVVQSPQPVFAAKTGLLLMQSLQAAFPELTFYLKAPNDIYINKKKLAGILLETIDMGLQRRLIVGIGINVLSAPSSLPATSLKSELKSKGLEMHEASWKFFLDQLTNNLRESVTTSGSAKLTSTECELIRDALNKVKSCDTQAIVVERISPEGDIVTAHGTQRWQDR